MKNEPNLDGESLPRAPHSPDPPGTIERTGLEPALNAAELNPELKPELSTAEPKKSDYSVPPRAAGSSQVSGPPTPDVVKASPSNVQKRATGKKGYADQVGSRPPKDASTQEKMTWLSTTLAKPNNQDFTDMMRWTKKTLVDAQVEEHGYRWMEKARPLIAKLDKVAGKRDVLRMKRTMILLVAADYMAHPRERVYELDYTATRQGMLRWMKDPAVFAIFNEIRTIMEDEVLEHEFEAIRHATRVTRMSAGRAAEVRSTLLEDPNPWVALQAARDIMQSADRQTASKGSLSTSLSISAELSDSQVQQLLERATTELEGWRDIRPDNAGLPDGRPLVIVEQQPVIELDDDELDSSSSPSD